MDLQVEQNNHTDMHIWIWDEKITLCDMGGALVLCRVSSQVEEGEHSRAQIAHIAHSAPLVSARWD